VKRFDSILGDGFRGGSMFQSKLFVVLVALVASGCTVSRRVAIDPKIQPQLVGVPAHVAVKNTEVGTRIPGSNVAAGAMGAASAVPGGFIAGFIIGAAASATDSAIMAKQAKTAEEVVTPIRNELVDLDLAEEISVAMKTEVATIPWVAVNGVVISKNSLPDTKQVREWISAAPGKSLLLVKVDHYFTQDFTHLIVRANVELLTRSVKLANPNASNSTILYSNDVATNFSLKEASGDGKANVAKWVDQKDYLRASLQAGVAELAKMVAYDIQQPKIQVKKEEAKTPVMVDGAAVNAQVVANIGLNGIVEKQENGRRWVRTVQGHLVSIE
jgi:hypothetical protein